MDKKIKIGDTVKWTVNGREIATGTLERVIGCGGFELAIVKKESGDLFKAIMSDLTKVIDEKPEPKTVTPEDFNSAVKKVLDYDYLVSKTNDYFEISEMLVMVSSGLILFDLLREELFGE